MSNLYENLVKVLKIGIFNDTYYQAMTQSRLEEDLEYKNLEEGLVAYLFNLENANISGYNKKNIYDIKNRLGITNIYEEKNFFTKLFVRDFLSSSNSEYEFREGIDIRSIYKHFASDELKKDLSFAEAIVTLNGKYITGMSEQVRSNENLMLIAIKHDYSKEVESFLSAKGEALISSKNALEYFKRKKDNSYLSLFQIYEDIFKKDENDNFPNTLFQNNVQNYWLMDSDFLTGLAKLDVGFINYIVEGKISLTPDSVRKKIKEKGKYYE